MILFGLCNFKHPCDMCWQFLCLYNTCTHENQKILFHGLLTGIKHTLKVLYFQMLKMKTEDIGLIKIRESGVEIP